MVRHHGYGGVGVVEWLVPTLLFAALIGVAVWALVLLMRRPYAVSAPSDAALEAARLRYARGESSRDDYVRIVADLGGTPPAATPPPMPPTPPSTPTPPAQPPPPPTQQP